MPELAPPLAVAEGGRMPAAPPVSTATGLPLWSADLTTEPPLRRQVCTASKTLLGPGMFATQGGHGEQSTPSQPVPSPGQLRSHHGQPHGPGTQLLAAGVHTWRASASAPLRTLAQMVKNLSQTTEMSRKVWRDYNDVIQID